IGAPSLRKNKRGKLRPVFEGGIAESIREAKTERENITDALSTLNLNKYDTILSYNKDNAIIASIDEKKATVADINEDEFEVARLQDNKVFRHVKERLDKGLESYIAEDIQEMKNMSLEDYKTSFGKDQEFTQQEKDAEV